MSVVGNNGDIEKLEWEYKGQFYKIISTSSTGVYCSVWKSKDKVKRSDGLVKEFTRKELKEYFNSK